MNILSQSGSLQWSVPWFYLQSVGLDRLAMLLLVKTLKPFISKGLREGIKDMQFPALQIYLRRWTGHLLYFVILLRVRCMPWNWDMTKVDRRTTYLGWTTPRHILPTPLHLWWHRYGIKRIPQYWVERCIWGRKEKNKGCSEKVSAFEKREHSCLQRWKE